MPVSLKRIVSSGALTIHGTCEVCGAIANFGDEVNMREAFKLLDKGDKDGCKRLLGKWYCEIHRP